MTLVPQMSGATDMEVRMETQQQNQIEQEIRQNWPNVRTVLQDLFPQVSQSNLDSARSVQDLVERISDLTHYSDRLVETRLISVVQATQGGYANKNQNQIQGQQNQQPQGQQGQGFGTTQASQQNRQYAGAASGAPFGG